VYFKLDDVLVDLSSIGVTLYSILFISLICISVYLSHRKEVTPASYFFSSYETHWFLMGVAVVSSCIFGVYVLGIMPMKMVVGSPLVFGVISMLMLVVMGLLIAPNLLKNKVRTIPEFFEVRFNKSCRLFLSTIYIVCNIFIRLLVILFIGNFLINKISGADAYSTILFILIITGTYVILDGFRAEVYVGIVQVSFILFGVIAFNWWMNSQGIGMSTIGNEIFANWNGGIKEASNIDWIKVILGLSILGFWFWCADQMIVQKVISTASISSVKKTISFSAALQILPIFAILIPGILFIKLPSGVISSTSISFPEGLQGGIIIAIASALMASIASLYNSTSLLVTYDFYRHFKSDASDRELIFVGRMTTLVILFFSILIIPICQSLSQNFCLTLAKTFAYIGCMVAAIFAVGLANNHIKALSALLTLYTTTMLICFRTLIDIFFSQYLGQSGFVHLIVGSTFLEFSIFVFAMSVFLLFFFDIIERYQYTLSRFRRIF